MSDSDNTRWKHDGRWPPGQSGNPAGRPRGSRNKLGEAFITELYADWIAHGAKVIATVRDEEPAAYLKIVASLLPKQLEIKDNMFDGVADEELAAVLAYVRDALRARPDCGARADETKH
jgi:hypothetical protein